MIQIWLFIFSKYSIQILNLNHKKTHSKLLMEIHCFEMDSGVKVILRWEFCFQIQKLSSSEREKEIFVFWSKVFLSVFFF